MKLKKIFVSALLFLVPFSLHSENDCCKHTPPFYSLKASDQLKFGRLWQQIKRFEEKDLLNDMIRKRRQEIFSIKSHWKEKTPSLDGLSLLAEVETLLQKGFFEPAKHGCGAAYILYDDHHSPQYVIKPFDEDILCLNNRKQFASPFNDQTFRVRNHIPLYRSMQAETLAYQLASLLGLENLTPSTHMVVISHENFFDIGDHLDPLADAHLLKEMGPIDREKLCSVQTYLEDTQNLYSLVEEWLKKNLTEEEILDSIDQISFENLSLFIWLLYDTDAHAGNLYAKKDANGIFHLLKIDNGLTFPDKNSHLLNALYFFPHAKRTISNRLCQVIQNLPLEAIIEKIYFFEMGEALNAFLERVEVLKNLTKEPIYTFREIDMRLHALELPDGREVALSQISLEELENLVSYE